MLGFKKEQPTTSIRKSMMFMMAGLTTGTICSLALSLVFIGVLPSLNDAAFRYLHNQSLAQSSRVSSHLKAIVSSSWRLSDSLGRQIDATLREERIAYEDLKYSQQITEDILASSYDTLVSLVGEQTVSGAFIILDEGYEMGGKASLYLRNSSIQSSRNPVSSYILLRGPSAIAAEKGISLDKCWSYGHSIADEEASIFYTKPMEAARTYTKAMARDLGYCSTRFSYEPSDIEITTYTIPIKGENGRVYGVCGVEMSIASLSRMVPAGTVPFDDGFYIYGQIIDDKILMDSVISNDIEGTEFLRQFNEAIEVKWESELYEIYKFRDKSGQNMLAAVVGLDLYERNSPFLGEGYQFLVIAPRNQVLSDSRNIVENIIGILLIFGVLSLLGGRLLSRSYSRKIEDLAIKVKAMDHERPRPLPRTQIQEVDFLSEALEKMNEDINRHAARMSTIVESVGMPMGAFEWNMESDRVFLTDSLFRLLEIPHSEEDSQYIQGSAFREILPQVTSSGREARIDIFCEPKEVGKDARWLRLNRTVSPDYVYGTVLDITEEMLQKARLEYERNYDSLTRLMNRNAYPQAMEDKIKAAPDMMGVLLFADLDNLKTINDTYGHNIGDLYILAGADGLKLFQDDDGVVARVAGDEFAVYLHGKGSREELRAVVDRVLKSIRETTVQLPDGKRQTVHVSAGLAYYPDDGKTIKDLIQYADFAMYEIKHTEKNGTAEFCRDNYTDSSMNQ